MRFVALHALHVVQRLRGVGKPYLVALCGVDDVLHGAAHSVPLGLQRLHFLFKCTDLKRTLRKRRAMGILEDNTLHTPSNDDDHTTFLLASSSFLALTATAFILFIFSFFSLASFSRRAEFSKQCRKQHVIYKIDAADRLVGVTPVSLAVED